MLFNADGRGLRKVIRDREERVLRVLWRGEASTGDLVEATGLRREQVLRILFRFMELGVVGHRDDYTMGAHRDIWTAEVDEAGFRRLVARRVLRSLLKDWGVDAGEEIITAIKRRPALKRRVREALGAGA